MTTAPSWGCWRGCTTTSSGNNPVLRHLAECCFSLSLAGFRCDSRETTTRLLSLLWPSLALMTKTLHARSSTFTRPARALQESASAVHQTARELRDCRVERGQTPPALDYWHRHLGPGVAEAEDIVHFASSLAPESGGSPGRPGPLDACSARSPCTGFGEHPGKSAAPLACELTMPSTISRTAHGARHAQRTPCTGPLRFGRFRDARALIAKVGPCKPTSTDGVVCMGGMRMGGMHRMHEIL